MQRRVIFVYLDDILVATKTTQEHLDVLKKVFQRIIQHKLKINEKKSNFAKDKLPFLKFDISAEGIQIDKIKQAKILKFEIPTYHTTLQSYLEYINYFKNFIHNCSVLLSQMYNVLTKKYLFAFTPEYAEGAVSGTNPFGIFKDASYKRIEACLMQLKDGHLRPIMFYSKSLQGAEKNYHITDLEALSLVSALNVLKTLYTIKKLKYIQITHH
ncbi:Retrotransposon-like protein 1 [Strongyloides ratti]|uniref:Retrotransposon-like protein 1 n=1 Tax=Strongyloides ratti TaxID=34506 RepID=A0A090KVC8_STRRB|nr:Retrotransposon-like protein 1 [Strongyloides ratti]CEF61475.1 Retrotransposon-like protein 1 [Strongyloides ratti]